MQYKPLPDTRLRYLMVPLYELYVYFTVRSRYNILPESFSASQLPHKMKAEWNLPEVISNISKELLQKPIRCQITGGVDWQIRQRIKQIKHALQKMAVRSAVDDIYRIGAIIRK